jgi:hypothetical protein
MPKNKQSKVREERNKWRRFNYERGKFGSRRNKNFNKFERWLIKIHIINDRTLAKLLHTSTNGIQVLRWRIKTNYNGMYR